MNVTPNPIAALKSFSAVRSELSNMDSSLTQWERRGNVCPDREFVNNLCEAAVHLDNATLTLQDTRPQEKALLNSLKQDTLRVGFIAGLSTVMQNYRIPFGRGWSEGLDASILDSGKAIDAATNDQSPTADPTPNPVQVLKQMGGLQAELSKWDGNLTQWRNAGNTCPGNSVPEAISGVAGSLYDARNSLRALHPEQRELLANLHVQTIVMAIHAGSLHLMSKNHINIGAGWETAMDDARSAVDKAFNLIAG